MRHRQERSPSRASGRRRRCANRFGEPDWSQDPVATHTDATDHGLRSRTQQITGTLAWFTIPVRFCRPVPRRQQLLFPDPRPLEDSVGRAFFQSAPTRPGVYLLRDATDAVVYVGKARNLRQRLASYRVANPERLGPRHLRLLRVVVRIEVRECADEATALAEEALLIRTLRPRFNRAGVWPGTGRYLQWWIDREQLHLAVATAAPTDGSIRGPFGRGILTFLYATSRLLWCASSPTPSIIGLPTGWIHGQFPAVIVLPARSPARLVAGEISHRLSLGIDGDRDGFADWISSFLPTDATPLDRLVWAEDLESLRGFRPKIMSPLTVPPPPAQA